MKRNKKTNFKKTFLFSGIVIIAVLVLASILIIDLTINKNNVSISGNVIQSGTCVAKTYYVNATTGNDANTGESPGKPWKTLSKLSSMDFCSGDIILLERGKTWNEILFPKYYIAGAAQSQITFGAYGAGERPIVRGIVLGGVSYVIVKDITCDFGGDGNLEGRCVNLISTNNVILDNLVVKNSVSAGIFVGSEIQGMCQNNVVKNCEVYNSTGNNPENLGKGIYFWGNKICKGNSILNNKIHNNDGGGIIVSESSFTNITSNEVYLNGAVGIGLGPASVLAGGEEATSDNIIEKNLVYSNGQKLDDIFGIDLYRVGNRNTVRYNTVHDQHNTATDSKILARYGGSYKYGTGGIRLDGNVNESYAASGNKVHHNIIYNEYSGIDVISFNNTEIYNNVIYNTTNRAFAIESLKKVSNTKFKNNIMQNPSAGISVLMANSLSNQIDYNIYYPSKPNISGQDSHSNVVDAKFVSVLIKDFHLQSNSPAINTGVDIGIIKDFDGNPIPYGNTIPDIGAFEYQGSLSPPKGNCTDLDKDGYNVSQSGCGSLFDCNDANINVNPKKVEICNGIDDNCNSLIDENLGNTTCGSGDCQTNVQNCVNGKVQTCVAKTITTWYYDSDNDGYGISSNTKSQCSQPSGYASQSGDCNDANVAIKPGATEIKCNGIDENCNGVGDDTQCASGYSCRSGQCCKKVCTFWIFGCSYKCI
ncbi:MAG: MopE-related protein [Candidatus Pacearchaeota archaeon]|jgi:hypothetical protein